MSAYQEVLGIDFEKSVLVNDFESWKQAYLAFQQEVDILFVRQISGIAGWDDDEALAFVYEHTVIPTGTASHTPRRFALIGYTKANEEFGQYGAETALRILAGTSPEDIPITTNKQAKVFLNMRLAKKLNIKFPMELIERATFVGEELK